MAEEPRTVLSYRSRPAPKARKVRQRWKLPRHAPLVAVLISLGAVAGAACWAIHLDREQRREVERSREQAEEMNERMRQDWLSRHRPAPYKPGMPR